MATSNQPTSSPSGKEGAKARVPVQKQHRPDKRAPHGKPKHASVTGAWVSTKQAKWLKEKGGSSALRASIDLARDSSRRGLFIAPERRRSAHGECAYPARIGGWVTEKQKAWLQLHGGSTCLRACIEHAMDMDRLGLFRVLDPI